MTIEERLEAIEKKLHTRKRRTIWMIAFGAILVIAFFSFGIYVGERAIQLVESVEGKDISIVKGLSIVDDRGETRAALTPLGLIIYDDQGKTRLTLTKESFSMWDEMGAQRVSFLKNGVFLWDEKEINAMNLLTSPDGPILIMNDDTKQRVTLGVFKGKAALILQDETGKLRRIP